MKVKLPKEVANALEIIRSQNHGDNDLIKMACGSVVGSYIETELNAQRIIFRWCQEDNLIRFVGALVNGYEVIEEPQVITITPEQKARAIRSYRCLEGDMAAIVTSFFRGIGIEWEEIQ
jgi:hypothetical protein